MANYPRVVHSHVASIRMFACESVYFFYWTISVFSHPKDSEKCSYAVCSRYSSVNQRNVREVESALSAKRKRK